MIDPFQRGPDGGLRAGDAPLAAIADAVGTPVYVYDAAAIRARYRAVAGALDGLDALIAYAVKANGNLSVIRLLAEMGAGADVVSLGELERALAAGVPAERIVFAGVGKTEAELDAALGHGIRQINVESEAELTLLDRVAGRRGVKAPVVLRVNPDVDAGTHAKITTGTKANKFGVAWERAGALFDRARDLGHLRLLGLSTHIGSQLTRLEPYAAAFARMRALTLELRAAGHAIERLDLGGGLGIRYRAEDPAADLAGWADLVRGCVAGLDVALEVEPGRFLVGEAGALVTRVVRVKEEGGKTFVVVDAGMNDLIRPTLYNAHHPIVPVAAPDPAAAPVVVDVVGPICESGDYLALDRALPPVGEGALLAVLCAGAYAAAMASTYNARPPAPEVLVDGTRFAIIKPRRALAELFADERSPEWRDARNSATS